MSVRHLRLFVGLASVPALVAAQPTTTPAPSRLSGVEERGVFRCYVNEDVIATIDFTWDLDGRYHGAASLHLAGETLEHQIDILPDSTGRWSTIRMQAPSGLVTVTRQDRVAVVGTRAQVSNVVVEPDAVLFDNFSPALMRLAVRRYDDARGGRQAFPVYVVPSVAMEASLERTSTMERTVRGRDVSLRLFDYALPGVTVTVYADETDRVVFADIPAQHAVFVREGYESLMEVAAVDSLVSLPEFEVVTETFQVPMRDGVKLATDVYRPDTTGPVPLIVVRTPYKKELLDIRGRYFARRGYAFCVQDCRGRFASGGKWTPFLHEATDGYDTIEWLAARPWSSGRVGMIGASYLGWVQWWAARERPPHLTTIIPNVSPPDPLLNIPYENGAFFLLGAMWWADVLESEATADLTGERFMRIDDKDYVALLDTLPVVDLDERVLGERNRYWREWIAHPKLDDYWEPATFGHRYADIDIPVFHQSGWFDGDGIGAKLNYAGMRAAGHEAQKLVLGPWGHTDTATRRHRGRDFGAAAIPDLEREYLRWFDYWLKGRPNGILDEPLVSLFIMGANEWRTGDVYPLPETKMRPLYLSSGGAANTTSGDGVLTWELPPAGTPPDRYTYDPADPTPCPLVVVEEPEESGAVDVPDTVSVERVLNRAAAYYANVNATRADILVYETPPLTEPLTIAGPLYATLFAATSARDTDWVMRVSEVDVGGAVFPLTQGVLRARYRNSLREPELLEPGQLERYTIDLWHTAIRLPAGHRLRVEVASATFPMFSRNLNTGGHNETETTIVVAEQTIYHDPRYPSHVVLPVLLDR